MIQTTLLIDGTDNPIALKIPDNERQTYVSQGRANDTARNFKFSHMIDDVAIYRLVTQPHNLSDELFQVLAKAEADKFLHPEKYKDMGKTGALSNSERDELERLRAMFRKE